MIFLGTSLSLQAIEEYYFAQDISTNPPGQNDVPTPTYPQSKVAAAAFLSRLNAVNAISFEGYSPGFNLSEVQSGQDLLTFSTPRTIFTQTNAAIASGGGFATSGTNYIDLQEGPPLLVSFSRPQAALGYYGMDVESQPFALRLVHIDDSVETVPTPIQRPQRSGGVYFVGVIDNANPFKAIILEHPTSGDGFFFDDFLIAAPHQVIAAKPDEYPTPILAYRFNEVGHVAFSSGVDPSSLALFSAEDIQEDLHSEDGKGVSGFIGDRAFDNSRSTAMGTLGRGGVAVASAVPAIGGLISFTLQGWLKCDSSPMDNIARIVDSYPRDDLNLLGAAGGQLRFSINGDGVARSSIAYPETNQWVYFAVSYDGTRSTNNVRFFKGTPTDQVRLVDEFTYAQVVLNSNLGIRIGNTSVNSFGDRPFDGWIDNLRLFGSKTNRGGVLAATRLEVLRLMDLSNTLEWPKLGFEMVGGELIVFWPASLAGYQLEYASGLNDSADWTVFSGVIGESGGRRSVRISPVREQFFRLRR
jgi:hypothetical protein